MIINKWSKAVGLILALLMTSCQSNPYPGIPDDSRFLDKAFGTTLFLHVDDSTCRPRKVTVWSYNQETREAKPIVSTTGEDIAVWCKGDTIKSYWPKDSIASIYSAKIISWSDKPLQIVVDGCPDQRNVWTYIVSEESDSVILLPTNAGFLGKSIEEDLLIGQSYEYYGQGGRYNVLKVFDMEGNMMQQIPINQRVNIPFDLYNAIEYDYDFKNVDLEKLVKENPQLSTEELIEIARTKFSPRNK